MGQAAYKKKFKVASVKTVLLTEDDKDAGQYITTYVKRGVWQLLPATSPSLEFSGDVLDDTNINTSSGYRSHVLGLHDWSCNADSYFDSSSDPLYAVKQAKIGRKPVIMQYLPAGIVKTADSSPKYIGYQGLCIVESFSLSGDVGGLESASINLKSRGLLTQAVDDNPYIIRQQVGDQSVYELYTVKSAYQSKIPATTILVSAVQETKIDGSLSPIS